MILALALPVLAACSKTTMNTIALTGKWEHFKTVSYEDTKDAQTWYPTAEGYRIFYLFESDGRFLKVTESLTTTATDSREATWFVDGNYLIVSYLDGPIEYRIQKAGLLEVVLEDKYTQNGHSYVDYIYLKKP